MGIWVEGWKVIKDGSIVAFFTKEVDARVWVDTCKEPQEYKIDKTSIKEFWI